MTDRGDLPLPDPDQGRGEVTSFVNEAALVAMVEGVGLGVSQAVQVGRFPVVYGGDCTTLLGTVPTLLHETGPVGLVFMDGHEDTTPLDVSEDGEAANTELGLLLGLTGRLLKGALANSVGVLDQDCVAVLVPRDRSWRQHFNVGSLREHGVWFRDWQQTSELPMQSAKGAVQHLQATAKRWWLHVDLDVLSSEEFPAQGVPGESDQPDGLTWDCLTTVLTTAVSQGGCIGWSIAIYDPDQDPSREQADRIVRLARDVASALE